MKIEREPWREKNHERLRDFSSDALSQQGKRTGWQFYGTSQQKTVALTAKKIARRYPELAGVRSGAPGTSRLLYQTGRVEERWK